MEPHCSLNRQKHSYHLCNVCFHTYAVLGFYITNSTHKKQKEKGKVGEGEQERECCKEKLVKKFLKLNYVGSRGLYHFDMLRINI